MNRPSIYLSMTALILNLGVASLCAQQIPVNMTFSGDGGPSAINLNLPNTRNGEENLAGNGTFGPFTFRLARAGAMSPQPSSTCSGNFFPTVAGAGLFRFQDGSLLKVKLTGGGDCIVPPAGNCTLTFQIEGGTGRFEGVSGGVLTLTETALPIFDDLGAPVFFTEVGGFSGWVGMSMEESPQNAQR
ncbi:MAG: hypothetical protein IT167_12325 [Bryobacterales bacterium]|nr:hypothetical protein [Bryobacterales bacterium]